MSRSRNVQVGPDGTRQKLKTLYNYGDKRADSFKITKTTSTTEKSIFARAYTQSISKERGGIKGTCPPPRNLMFT